MSSLIVPSFALTASRTIKWAGLPWTIQFHCPIGGAPKDLRNVWPEPKAQAKRKY
jgi:hypothetical protein